MLDWRLHRIESERLPGFMPTGGGEMREKIRIREAVRHDLSLDGHRVARRLQLYDPSRGARAGGDLRNPAFRQVRLRNPEPQEQTEKVWRISSLRDILRKSFRRLWRSGR
jgi:hypothetical protein